MVLWTGSAPADDVSAPAMLQMFEARWPTIEDRLVDIFIAGYGGLWLPPPGRADTGALSVGYDVFDRFDLGLPRSETLYGTDSYFGTLIGHAHRAALRVHTDLVLNHNGFRDASTPGFVAAGDYPGFVTTLSWDIDGDFHGRFEQGEENSRLAGLIDIAQEKNHQFIRHPVDPNDPNNIPGGTSHDLPDPNNARFYPDQELGGTTVFDPRLNQTVTLYDFNVDDPLAGDPILENATGLLMRHMRWMVQEFGVDGFRLDAARHMPRWVLDYVDQAVFLSKRQPRLDGSQDHPFIFSEAGYDSPGFLQSFIRKDIDPDNLGRVGGNRDVLDFNLFGAITNNLTSNGLANDWRTIKGASIDHHDDGYGDNGSQGVAFVRSHDELGAYLVNVAHAYMLMRPGNAIVYFNAEEFGPAEFREFPRGGQDDALGGLYGDTITTLVNLRNSHGRGNYRDRTPAGDEKEMLVYEREKSAVIVLSNRLDSGFDARSVQTAFKAGTVLVELSGNAEDPLVDPLQQFPSVVTVQPGGTIAINVPRNRNANGEEHGKGYLIYGVAAPQGQLRLTDSLGQDIDQVLPGGTPGPTTNGTTRLADVTVVSEDTFSVRLETNPVTLAGGFRDRHADGDQALLRIDGGLEVNLLPGVDHVTPDTVAYGFEEFTGLHQPGFFDPKGSGVFEQAIDAAQLSEGVHFITARAFRHRDPSTYTDNDPTTVGDGGPAVFADFRQAIYVDRLPPQAEFASFEPYGTPAERDLIFRSADQTAEAMHLFLNVPAGITDEVLFEAAAGGNNRASQIDRDLFVYGFAPVPSGNNVATALSIEPTGNWNVQRFPGLYLLTGHGLGLGDVNADNQFSPADLLPGEGTFEFILYSQHQRFHPAADVNADGLVDNHDLFLLGGVLETAGADPVTLDAYQEVLVRRGDVDQSGVTDAADIDDLYANLGSNQWRLDMDVDGIADFDDVVLLVEVILSTLFGDANLDRTVDGLDFVAWNQHKFQTGTGWATGDFNGDGVTDGLDFVIWNSQKFQGGSGATVPEPAAGLAAALASIVLTAFRRNHARIPARRRRSAAQGW
jgi:glycosidase